VPLTGAAFYSGSVGWFEKHIDLSEGRAVPEQNYCGDIPLYQFAGAVITNYHKLRGFNQLSFILNISE
jgi:hypothetical protein